MNGLAGSGSGGTGSGFTGGGSGTGGSHGQTGSHTGGTGAGDGGALERARQAANQSAGEAIERIRQIGGNSGVGGGLSPDGKSSLSDFLSGDPVGGGGYGTGTGGVGGGTQRAGLDGVSKLSASEIATAAQQKGYQVPTRSGVVGVPTTISRGPVGMDAGAGMMPPPMGGAGAGMGGGQEKKDRERTVWLTSDGKDWEEDDENTAGPSTLGRS